MKVVDVLSTKVYNDSQQIIAQVMNLFVWSVLGLVFLFSVRIYKWFCAHLWLHECFALQGDLADCFYIVESGQVRISMKRSRVCLPSLPSKCKKNLLWCFLVSYSVFFFHARRKKTRRKRKWISPHALGASILGSWRLSQTSPELHQPMLWGASNAWVHFLQFYDYSHIMYACKLLPVYHYYFT